MLMTRPSRHLLCVGALALLGLTSLSAHAQYSWIDDKGTRVFSDRPPPPGTPPDRILKMPRGMDPRLPQAETAAAPSSTAAEADKAPEPALALAKREAEFRKRAAQREDEEKKEAAHRREHRTECAVARGNQQTLTTARRISRTDNQGKSELMSDDDRAREMEKIQRTLQGCP